MVQKEAKKKTPVVSAVLLSIMIISLVCFIGSASLASGSPTVDGSLSEKETNPNNYAGGLAGKLKSSFNTTYSDGRLEILYPLEYGGAYIDSSNNLHIVLSKYATNSTIDSYRSIMGDPDVIFEAADFPLSHLYAVQDALDRVMLDLSIDATGINEITNRLDVNMHNSTKQRDVIEFLNNQFNDFNGSCITFLGPLEISAGLGEINPPMVTPESYTGFLGTDIPLIYGAAVVAIIVVTIAFGVCYLAFVRHGTKPQGISDN